MKMLLLIGAVVIMIIIGYYGIKKVDRFMTEARKEAGQTHRVED